MMNVPPPTSSGDEGVPTTSSAVAVETVQTESEEDSSQEIAESSSAQEEEGSSEEEPGPEGEISYEEEVSYETEEEVVVPSSTSLNLPTADELFPPPPPETEEESPSEDKPVVLSSQAQAQAQSSSATKSSRNISFKNENDSYINNYSSRRSSGIGNADPPPAETSTTAGSKTTGQTETKNRNILKKNENKQTNSKATALLVISILIVAAGLAVIIYLFVDSNNDDETPAPTISPATPTSPTESPIGAAPFAPGDTLSPVDLPPSLQEPLTEADRVNLLEVFASVVGDSVYQQETSQALAADWIFFEDPRREDGENTEAGPLLTSEDHEMLLQRYLVVFFYYSTTLNKQESWLSCGEPDDDESDFCMYLKLVTPPYDEIEDDIVSLEYVEIPWIRWLTAADECDWAGMTCAADDDIFNFRRVTDIDLAGQRLKGPLVSEIALGLPGLQALIFNVNDFSGTLVEAYGQLETLEVAYNDLTGTIPSGMFRPTITLLQSLNIGHNMLDGTLPEEISFATDLRNLFVFDNEFTGEISPVLGQLALERFQAQGNRFVGTLPLDNTNLFWSNTLEQFWVQNNRLTGAIPPGIDNFKRLEEFRISSNSFRGAIPDSLYDVTSLVQLHLDNNALAGTISPLINRLLSLEVLDLSSNSFSGPMVDLSPLTKLEIVKMQFNQLTGAVPTGICSLFIQGLNVQYSLESLEADCLPISDPPNSCACCTVCCDRGTLSCDDGSTSGGGNGDGNGVDDPEIADLEEYIGDRLGGDVDLSLGTIHAIAIFWMAFEDPLQLTVDDSNFLQRYILVVFYISTAQWRSCNPIVNDPGQTSCVYEKFVRIEDDITVYEQVPAIRWLSAAPECDWVGVECDGSGNVVGIIELFGQGLDGTIPTELVLLPGFKHLQIAYNDMTGTISPSFGDLPDLETFMVQGNSLTGPIPDTFFVANDQLSSFIVGDNLLTGIIPTVIGAAQALQSFHVDSNLLNGPIPMSFYSLIDLQSARLNDNAFTGTIPENISNLRFLQEFWLDSNSLAGPILPSGVDLILQFIGDSLVDFRLSNNQFDGTIPSTIGLLTKLEVFRLDENRLVGSLPTEFGSLSSLVELQVNDNELSGTIPSQLGNLSNLELLWIQTNNIDGEVPSEVCSLPELDTLLTDCLEVECACCAVCCVDGEDCQ